MRFYLLKGTIAAPIFGVGAVQSWRGMERQRGRLKDVDGRDKR